MDLPDTMIFGFVAILTVSIIAVIGFLFVGEYLHPTMSEVANDTLSNDTPIDVQPLFDFGANIFYIVMGLCIAIPFLLIIAKFFYEKEHTTV